MICPACRTAADAGVEDTPGPDEVLIGVFQRELHDQCPGATVCDCQHRVAIPEPER